MPDTAWEIIVPLLSPLISLGALVWAVYQIKNVLRQNYQKVYDMNIGIDKFFFEHPDMRKYFYPDVIQPAPRGPEVPADAETRRQVDAVAEMMLDFFDSVCHQKEWLPGGTYDHYANYMRTVYRYSPALQACLQARKEWYPERLQQTLSEQPKLTGAAAS